MPRMMKHKDMMKERQKAFADEYTSCYRRGTDYARRFYLAGEWWRGSRMYNEQKQNKPKPEFHQLWRPTNRTIGALNDIEMNAVIHANSDQATDEGADLLKRRWRNDSLKGRGAFAKENANAEMVVRGFGCVKLVAKFEDPKVRDLHKQDLCIEPVIDATNCVRFSVDSTEIDKSDATLTWELIKGNQEAFEKKFGRKVASFPHGESFAAYGNYQNEQKDCYIAHVYQLVEVSTTIYDLTPADPMMGLKVTVKNGKRIGEMSNGQQIQYTKSELDEMLQTYERMMGEPPETDSWDELCIMTAIADGEKYLTKPQMMPFNRTPIIPQYAYHTIVDGIEFFCGEIEKQSDIEMFNNVYGSAMLELLMYDQVEKNEYLPQQINRHLQQRADQNKKNNPVLLSDPYTDDRGNVFVGPIGKYTPPGPSGGAVAAGQMLEGMRAGTGTTGQVKAPANTSAEAIAQVNERSDDALLPLVKASMHANRALCECYIPAAQQILFSAPRSLRVMNYDNTHETIMTMQVDFDREGNRGLYGNNPMGNYTVTVEKGQAYKDQKKQNREDLLQAASMTSDPQTQNQLSNAWMQQTEGEALKLQRKMSRFDEIREYVSRGYPIDEKDFTEEELMYIQGIMQQMQQAQQQPSPDMVAAQAQQTLAEAEMIKAEQKDKEIEIDAYEAQTERVAKMGDLEYKGVKLQQDKERDMLNAVGRLSR